MGSKDGAVVRALGLMCRWLESWIWHHTLVLTSHILTSVPGSKIVGMARRKHERENQMCVYNLDIHVQASYMKPPVGKLK